MMTSRGWWLFLTMVGMLTVGAWGPFPLLKLVSLALMVWFCQEWLLFAIRAWRVVPALKIEREVRDDRGPVSTLWAERAFEVRVALHTGHWLGLPYIVAMDAVPFSVEEVGGERSLKGALNSGNPLSLNYRVRCPSAGLARFEGMSIRLADLQGLFYYTSFVRAPIVLRILPVPINRRPSFPTTKRINELPPPGVHRLHRPGSGSELLDLRDYLPGDPPKTIAWKISARRDRLITKEFESEVPIRCTLFVDTSNSVRLATSGPLYETNQETRQSVRALDRLIEIAASVARANVAAHDLTVLCLFDEHGSSVVKPDRTGPHLTQMLHRLADAAALDATAIRISPEELLPVAYTFARDVYPDLLASDINGMPWWINWFFGFPGQSRRKPGLLSRLYQRRLPVYIIGSIVAPALAVLTYAVALIWVFATRKPQQIITKTIAIGLVLTIVLSALSATSSSLFFGLMTFFGGKLRRMQATRKQMAALLAVRYGLVPGGLQALLEDDDQLALLLQRFLSEHRVPYVLPLYDAEGDYLFGAPDKVPWLATAIVQAVGRGRDNELFVLLADLLELDDQLEPLLRAVKVALGRHHQVLLVCPWPPSIPLPEGEEELDESNPFLLIPTDTKLPRRLTRLTIQRFHNAFHRIRHTFGRIGVQVVCAASNQPVAMILDRIERLRLLRRVH